MTRKEKELKMIEAIGLKIGDTLRSINPNNFFYKIIENEFNIGVIEEKLGIQYQTEKLPL